MTTQRNEIMIGTGMIRAVRPALVRATGDCAGEASVVGDDVSLKLSSENKRQVTLPCMRQL